MTRCNHGLKESINNSLREGRQVRGQALWFLPCSQCVLPKHLLLVPVGDRLLGEVCRAHVWWLALKAKHKGATVPLKSRGLIMGGSLGIHIVVVQSPSSIFTGTLFYSRSAVLLS